MKEEVIKRYSERISRNTRSGESPSCCSTDMVLTEENKVSKNGSHEDSSCSGSFNEDMWDKLGNIEKQSFGCGNPVGLSSVREYDIVIDLGSGAGLDCIRAASGVGTNGKVVGVDLSDEMIARARQNARKMQVDDRVSFVKGDIENIPLQDNYASLVISNCVLALAPDKEKVFNEVYRVLKPGGRFVISDVVSESTIPSEMRDDAEFFSSCVSGASQVDQYFDIIKKAGFTNIEELDRKSYGNLDPDGKRIEMFSITVRGYKRYPSTIKN